MSDSKETRIYRDVNTEGGAYVEGGVSVDGDFVGRDQIIHGDKIVYHVQEASGLRPLDKQPVIAPKLPPNFLERSKELDDLRQLVTKNEANQDVGLTAVHGMGGIGKSVLVSALCHDPDVQKAFPDGVIWVSVGRNPISLVDQMKTIGVALGDRPPYYTSPEASAGRLSEILATRAVLIVLDDVWKAQHVRKFQFDAPKCHIVFTTRSSTVAQSLDAASVKLGVLKPDDAIELLREISKSNAPELAEIAKCLGHLPLALNLAGKRLLEEGMNAALWLNRYRERVSELRLDPNSTDPLENLEACFDLSTEQLAKEQRPLYYSLGIFPEDVWISQEIVFRFWRRLAPDLEEHKCSDLIDALSSLALIDLDGESVNLHDLLHDYNRHKLGKDWPKYHENLLSVYNPEDNPWYTIENDGYLYPYLSYHMINAGRERDLFNMLASATTWMEATLDEPNLALESLLVDIWHQYWEKHQQEANDFLIEKWLPRSMDDRGQKGYTARVIAVRCAFEVDHDDGLAAALSHPDGRVRSAAMTHAYYLSKRELGLDRVVKILKATGEQITSSGLLPNTTALQSIFLLAPLMVIDQYQEGNLNSPAIKEIVQVLTDSVHATTSKSLLRLFGPAARSLAIRAGMGMINGLLKRAESSSTSINNFSGISQFFDHEEAVREQTRSTLVYLDRTTLDRTNRSLADISDLILGLYQAGDRISILLAEYILIGHGIHKPDEVEAFIQEFMANNKDPGCVYAFSVAAIWYSIVYRQPDSAVAGSYLETMESIVTQWLDSGRHGYGGVQSGNQVFQTYPLAYYAALWTKAYPGVQVDLLEKYAGLAEKEDDQQLRLHIIGSFSDYRQILYDYPTVLCILTPYVKGLSAKSTNNHWGEIREELVKSLGTLRGLRPAPVDAFLEEVDAPLDLRNDICSQSYQKPADELYIRFYQVISDVTAYAPISFVRQIIDILDKALVAPSMDKMVAILVNEIIALIEASKD